MNKPENMDIVTSPSLTSLHSYIGEILKSSNMDNTRERMKNEWARYITFVSFPRSSRVQPIRLAQSGFYYSGTGDETICFSCGLKYKNWKEGDSPFDVHKKLSPSCDFVNGSGDGNVPIRSRRTDFVLNANSLTCFQDKDKAVTLCKNSTENVKSNNKHENEVQPKQLSAMDRTGIEEQPMNYVNACNTELRGSYGCTGKEKNKSSLSERPKGQPVMFQDNIKIAECLEKPKHPHYSVMTSRLESFRGWPSYLQQKPADLAAAGFYYVGVGDCVRCFFCGGGLRSWEEGDNPWEEHAQWYPDCVFLKQCKGDLFVLRQLNGINLRSDESLQIKPHDNVTLVEKCEDIPCLMTLGSEAREMDPGDPIDCPAAKSILAMGYNVEMVRYAVRILASKKGHDTFSAIDLMEIIFELEENPSEDSDSSRLTAQVPTEATVQHKVSKPKELSVDKNEQSGNDSLLNHNDHVEEKKNGQSTRNSLSAEELKSMLEQNQELKDQATCKICLDRDACIVFLPCCHMMSCPQCAPALRKCPVCRQLIKGTVRAYIS
ncbi:hypothetical protein CHS0354_027940 [Potamilus streckersoni]|uniref:RING-type domain-containing protein n=1 Tax=Potamilus streckersoni TaxID=2493646 RepID=A0AAE0W744_9BIVA|nr:hypothetical protein CHS0354_027940 [Potamilus streckersoni]